MRISISLAIPIVVVVLVNPVRAQGPAAQAAAPGAAVGGSGPTLQEALAALTAATGAASKMGTKVSCAVVDPRGDLIAIERMDQGRFQTPDIARGKAATSALFGQPSGSVAQMASSPMFQKLNGAAQGRLYPIQGGVPIMRNNQLYGAIGCSGGTPQQDEDSAKAGLAAF